MKYLYVYVPDFPKSTWKYLFLQKHFFKDLSEEKQYFNLLF